MVTFAAAGEFEDIAAAFRQLPDRMPPPSIGPTPATIQRYRSLYENELFEHVIPFWERYSPDSTHGGTFNNLDRDGTVYDTTKHVWLLARQVWMFAKLYRDVEQLPGWLRLARSGMEFLRQYAVTPDRRVYFALAADGRPVYRQRKIFSECFYIMALAEYARAANEMQLMKEAKDSLGALFDLAGDPVKIGRPTFAGVPQMQTLAVPMILLNVLSEVAGNDLHVYGPEIDDLVRRVRLHMRDDTQAVHEYIAPDGGTLPGPTGRLLNPGHAIEAGWFLQQVAQQLERKDIEDLALDMVRRSYHLGWDTKHGGLYYFMDSDGYSPTQLEWSMKLWWPHCEALYAHLLDHSLTGNVSDWNAFEETHRYVWSHFVDPVYGEWYGYLGREGRVTHRFKGGPYKGCFHVPRALWLCWRLLGRM